MKTRYVVVNTVESKIGGGRAPAGQFDSAARVALFLLGKRLSDWAVLKIDDRGTRMVNLPNADFHAIEQDCIDA